MCCLRTFFHHDGEILSCTRVSYGNVRISHTGSMQFCLQTLNQSLRSCESGRHSYKLTAAHCRLACKPGNKAPQSADEHGRGGCAIRLAGVCGAGHNTARTGSTLGCNTRYSCLTPGVSEHVLNRRPCVVKLCLHAPQSHLCLLRVEASCSGTCTGRLKGARAQPSGA